MRYISFNYSRLDRFRQAILGSYMVNVGLIQQGVHIAEFHDLEELARDRVYQFCYVSSVNKIKGTTAGFTLRPIAIF